MYLIAITGGIGSGKSSVSERLVGRGAVLIDADAIVRQLQEPGQKVYEAMVERWGPTVVHESGGLNRQAVADLVFSDEAELAALNAIVHPEVRSEMGRQITMLAETDSVVLQDIPLLAETGKDRAGPSSIVVVDCPVEVAIERLVEHRGFSAADARARIEAQASRDERRALADFVVDNSGDLKQLDAEVERCWSWIASLEPTVWMGR